MRFDIYLLPAQAPAGYMVDVQSDYLSHLDSRMVIPLIAADKFKTPVKSLHPTFDIEGKPFVLMTHETASLRKKFLQRRVGSLADHRDEIMRALDLLFTGF